MGYGKEQIKELEKTINHVKCDVVIDSTPADLKRIISVNKPIVEVDYELGRKSVKKLEKVLKKARFI
jgi:predicted GTPase